MAAATIRHRPYDIVICDPLNTDQRLVNCASRGMLLDCLELTCSAQLSTNTMPRVVDNVTGQSTHPPGLVHVSGSIRCR
jgi:hypothetical protein